MRRAYQLLKSRWLRFRQSRRQLAKLRGSGLVLRSQRALAYRQKALALHTKEAQAENTSGQLYYLAQVLLLNYLLDDLSQEPILRD